MRQIRSNHLSNWRIAVIHDWLTTIGGAERVLERIIGLFPEADIFSVVDFLSAEDRGWLDRRPVRTSFIQGLPLASSHYRSYLPLMPFAVSRWDLSEYDLVISSSHSVAKGVRTTANQKHICYIHTPMRYAWDLRDHYLDLVGYRGGKSFIARRILDRIQRWDYATAKEVDSFIANSMFVADRVKRFYDRDATVVYPPIDIDRFQLSRKTEPFFLTVSRLVPYKRIDLIAETFKNFPQNQLVIVGDGPEMNRVRAIAGANVTILGHQTDQVVTDLMMRCRAFIFAAIEDFGIAPLEAQACGKPVIAFAEGGALETMRGLGDAAPSSVMFEEQTPASLKDGINKFVENERLLTPINCRKNAERFSASTFDAGLLSAVEQTLSLSD